MHCVSYYEAQTNIYIFVHVSKSVIILPTKLQVLILHENTTLQLVLHTKSTAVI